MIFVSVLNQGMVFALSECEELAVIKCCLIQAVPTLWDITTPAFISPCQARKRVRSKKLKNLSQNLEARRLILPMPLTRFSSKCQTPKAMEQVSFYERTFNYYSGSRKLTALLNLE